MPRKTSPPRLWLQPARYRNGVLAEHATWLIKDGPGRTRTGCGEGERTGPTGADARLGDYIKAKAKAAHEKSLTAKQRDPSEIWVADVLTVYNRDVAKNHARPKETSRRIDRLLDFFGLMRLSDVTGASCRLYATERKSLAAARRELEDLRAANVHYHREGFCSVVVGVVLPDKIEWRELRAMTRAEAAKLLWALWRYREIQKGEPTKKAARAHAAKFTLVGLYTGSRSGAICAASFEPMPGRGWVDLDQGVFHRRRRGTRETKKRQPPVRLPDRLLAHMRRWYRKGQRYVVELNGKPVASVRKAFTAGARDAGLRGTKRSPTDVTPHVLRHTAATWLMQQGVDLWESAGFLGMTVEMLERVYGHHHPDFQKNAAGAISRRPGQAGGQT